MKTVFVVLSLVISVTSQDFQDSCKWYHNAFNYLQVIWRECAKIVQNWSVHGTFGGLKFFAPAKDAAFFCYCAYVLRISEWSLALVVQRADSLIQRIICYLVDKLYWLKLHLIHFIAIYPLDRVICSLNNLGLIFYVRCLLIQGFLRAFSDSARKRKS